MARPAASTQIVRTLAARGPMSRADLARALDLAESTVSTGVADLVAHGTLEEASSVAEGRSGRPAITVRLARAAGLVLGIDLGKRHARVAVADLAHVVLAELEAPVSQEQDADAQIARIVALVDRALDAAGGCRSDVVAAAMGLPGPVHHGDDRMGVSTILPSWQGVAAQRAMRRALDLEVHVENDANLGALGEATWGAARGADPVVYVKVATGVGAGIVLGGELFTGARGTAGELGHTVIDPAGPRCRCGHRGCLETLAGSAAILDELGERESRLDAVLAAARDGDPVVGAAVARSGRRIGAALGTVCNLLDPQRIVVGGTWGTAGEALLGPLREGLATGAIPSVAEGVELVAGVLGERAEVWGALALALRRAEPRRLAGID